LFLGPIKIGFRLIDFHSFIVAGTIMVLAANTLSFAAITRVYAYRTGLLPSEPEFYPLFKYFNLEKGLALGVGIFVVGLILGIWAIILSPNFNAIGFDKSVRLVFGASLAVIIGGQIILTSFVLSILGIVTSVKQKNL